MNKLINFYVELYIGDDSNSGNYRNEIRRLFYLFWHAIVIFVLSSAMIEGIFEMLGKLFGVIK